jgi:hypothetical protein
MRDDAQSEALLPHSAATSVPTDAELELGILDALAKGLDGVAEVARESARRAAIVAGGQRR